MATTIIKGELQIDHERGVIYFHASVHAQKGGICPTPLRICGIGQIPFPQMDRQIDITAFPQGSRTVREDDYFMRITK